MLPFVFSLALPLLAGVNPPTWSFVRWTNPPDLRTLEPAEKLYLGTQPVDALDAALHKAAPPLWWMLCDWLDAPRSPEPAVSVTPCDLDDRYKTARLANQP